MPPENGSDDAEAAICADIGTSRAVVDAAKHQGLASLSGFPSEVRASLTMIVDAAGPNVLRRLWDAFVLSDDQLASVLGGRVHPAAAQWLASWNELQGEG